MRFTFASTPLLAAAGEVQVPVSVHEDTELAKETAAQQKTNSDSGKAVNAANKKKSSKNGGKQQVSYHYRRKKK